MSKLFDLADNKGRVNYEQLKKFVSETSLADFTEQAQHPILIGKELYEGEITRKAGLSAAVTNTSTMRFSVAAFKNIIHPAPELGATTRHERPGAEESGITRAIYLLKKKLYSNESDLNLITIGRAGNNDIVIADYVISKAHAQIVIFRGMYFIVDLGSTNGTKVNQQLIQPKLKVQLQVNSTIAFGRICFVFAHPLQVYRGLRKEILGL
ncbi:MAG: hypothetical protein A2X49_07195 [Lentisphaerae bacterium GWF2_52_8]|nr:MAG: hypothetical protein A2X49_07195 [Lentisphaerae bacterium GWF2_52_8]